MAKIYVGTYAKYNSGKITGAWLDCEDYSDKEEFLEACTALHQDEEDPELMYQDWEDIPAGMVAESSISEELWTWLDLAEDDRALLRVYRENVNQDADLDEAQEAYEGQHNSPAEWAEEFIDSCGMLESMPSNLRSYFDYESYARDCGYDGMSFIYEGGSYWVFRAV